MSFGTDELWEAIVEIDNQQSDLMDEDIWDWEEEEFHLYDFDDASFAKYEIGTCQGCGNQGELGKLCPRWPGCSYFA